MRAATTVTLLRVAVLLTGIAASLQFNAHPQDALTPTNILRGDFWDTDGTVHALIATNGTLYLGGSFSYLAPKGGKASAYDRHTGQPIPDFPRIVGSAVHAILPDGTGGWFIGGAFNKVDGLPRTNLVHIRGDLSVNPTFHPNPDEAVLALALDDSTLYAGGEFNAIGGRIQQALAALDRSSGETRDWPGANGPVNALHLQGDQLYAGGGFTSIGGQPRNRIAALDPSSGLAKPWNPDADGLVLSLAAVDNQLIAAGFFNRIGGQLRNGLAALDPTLDTNNATPWNPDPEGGKATVVRADCQTVYVGGYFTHIAGLPRHRVAAIESDSGLPTDWNPRLEESPDRPGSVLSMEWVGDTIYIGGEFVSANGLLRNDLVAVSATTSAIVAWSPNPGGTVQAIAVSGATLVAGFLKSPGGVERRNLAALDALTGQPTGWAPRSDGPIFSLAISDTTLYAGGRFSEVDGLPRRNLVAIDAQQGRVETNWLADADDEVLALACTMDSLFVGGRFNTVNDATRYQLAALNLDNGTAQPWTPVLDGPVHALLASDATLYAGGSFITVNGQTRRHLAAFDSVTGNLVPWSANTDHRVRALALLGTTLYLGGEFTSIEDLARPRLAAIDIVTGLPTPWNPGADADVRALVATPGRIDVGGTFVQLAGQQRFGAGALDPDGTLHGWNPGNSPANRAHALAFNAGHVYIGGEGELRFQSSNDRHSLGAFPPVGAPVLLQPLSNQEVFPGETTLFTLHDAGDDPRSYQWSLDGVAIPAATNSTLLLSNTTPQDAGAYSVLVTNALSAITASATLTVLEPVAILTPPPSQTAAPGETVTLSVVATGSPAPRYQWRLNGVNIPGAVFPTLTIANAQPRDGGAYQVIAANRLGALVSDIATVSVGSPPLPAADSLSEAGLLVTANGVGHANNAAAGAEANEPLHAGKRGGASLWIRWMAPATGIATFDTRGSAFDTLLGIYTGPAPDQLSGVADDEDHGGFLTSRASFNAVAGMEYLIAMDGLAGARGDIVLSWDLDTGTAEFPRILTHPLALSVSPGATATFSVDVASPTPVHYQWFLGCRELPGATNDTLVIANTQPRHLGAYRVVVFNNSARAAESRPASLELGLEPGALSFDKLEDALARYEIPSDPPGAGSGGSAPGGFLLVNFGSIVSQTFRTSENTTSLHETNHCGVSGGASAWLVFEAAHDGVVLVDTKGSDFDTVLSIYYPTNLSNLPHALVACDNNGASDGIRSQLRFEADAGRPYLAVVDGVDGARGLARIRWTLGTPPILDPATTNTPMHSAEPGGELTLSISLLDADPAALIRWFLNGYELPGATQQTLPLTNLQFDAAGEYSIVASNFAGTASHLVANLRINRPPQVMSLGWILDGYFHGHVVGNPGDPFILQSSTDLEGWLDLQFNQINAGPLEFVDPVGNARRHFYRVLPLDSPSGGNE